MVNIHIIRCHIVLAAPPGALWVIWQLPGSDYAEAPSLAVEIPYERVVMKVRYKYRHRERVSQSVGQSVNQSVSQSVSQ